LLESLSDRFRTGRQEEQSAQPLRDAFDAEGGVLLFELDDLPSDRRRQLVPAPESGRLILQAFLTQLPVPVQPVNERAFTYVQFLADQALREALLQTELDGPDPELDRVAGCGRPARRPPRGSVVLLLYFSSFFHVTLQSFH